jgi:hypothetical protein
MADATLPVGLFWTAGRSQLCIAKDPDDDFGRASRATASHLFILLAPGDWHPAWLAERRGIP